MDGPERKSFESNCGMTTVKIDTRNFQAMTRELAARAKVPLETVLVAEVGKVLEGAVRNTKAASRGKIRARAKGATFSMQPASLYTPKNGRSGVTVTQNGFIPYYLRNRYPNALWSLIAARREASLAAAIKAIGLAKKSWYDIAKRLGLEIKAPGYAKTALPSSGKEYPENTATKIERKTGRLNITIFNSQPTVNLIGGERALQQAVDGRVKGFIYAMATGTFDSMAKIAKKYPGITLK